ncbi:MAG TPA: ATP-binding protein [Pseudonocardiaceae bacterium]|jgi:AAA+ superfamily predicted ATPase
MADDAVLSELLVAVNASPDVVPLRLQVAGLLADRGRYTEALTHCTAALQHDPGNAEALTMLQLVSAALARPQDPEPPAPETPAPVSRPKDAFDWSAAEEQVADLVEPAFVQDQPPGTDPVGPGVDEDVERPAVRLDDVGGMTEVKQRLELAVLGPMRNPELARAFGKTIRGGLLLYGPPGCGKTFLARAVAGELGARFYPVGLSDVLDMYVGASERNLKEIFDVARRNAPCVLFFDEIDAIGQKRSQLRHSSSMRNTVNQLLTELDSVHGDNKGVFVLGATNHPWDVDSALRRPGRFDRMLLVLPPDPPARDAILRYHLRDRPLSGIDLQAVVRSTADFSGADLAHLCESATERALAESIATGSVRPVTMSDLQAALREVRPSTGPWFATARNVATFANSDGSYDDLVGYLRARKR